MWQCWKASSASIVGRCRGRCCGMPSKGFRKRNDGDTWQGNPDEKNWGEISLRSRSCWPIPRSRATSSGKGNDDLARSAACPPTSQGRHAEKIISELNGWPVCALVNASPAMLPWPAHDSGLERFANPFPCGSLIRYSMPILRGVFSNPIFPQAGILYPAPSAMQCPGCPYRDGYRRWAA